MASITVSSNPSTTGDTLTVNFTTDATNISDILISKDGGTTYTSATSFTNSKAVFNVSSWDNGVYSNCKLKCVYTQTSTGGGSTGGGDNSWELESPSNSFIVTTDFGNNTSSFMRNEKCTYKAGGMTMGTGSYSVIDKYLSCDLWKMEAEVEVVDKSSVFGFLTEPIINGVPTSGAQKGALMLFDSGYIRLYDHYTGYFKIPTTVRAQTPFTIAAGKKYKIKGQKHGWIYTFTITETTNTSNTALVTYTNDGKNSNDEYCGKGWGLPGVCCVSGSIKVHSFTYDLLCNSKPKAIIFGDSITEGTNLKGGTGTYDKWSAQVRDKYYNGDCLICGRGWSTTNDMMLRMKAIHELGIRPQEKVIVLIGTNDVRGADEYLEGWKKDMKEKVVPYINNTFYVDPVICCLPLSQTDTNDRIKKANAWILQQGWKSPRFDKATSANGDGTTYTGDYSSDGLHPNKLGSDRMYAYFKACMTGKDVELPGGGTTGGGDSGGGTPGGGDSGGGTTTIPTVDSWSNTVKYVFNWIPNCYVSNSDGSNAADASGYWSSTPYLNCKGTTNIIIFTDTFTQYFAWYDSNKKFIKAVNLPSSGADMKTPDGACYFRFSAETRVTSKVTVEPRGTASEALTISTISDITKQEHTEFYIYYSTNKAVSKHEFSWDGGHMFYDKTSEIIVSNGTNYKYKHDNKASAGTYNMAIRVTDANGNTKTSNVFKLTLTSTGQGLLDSSGAYVVDDFSSGTVDSDKWSYELGYVRNGETQKYTNSNAEINNGILALKAKKASDGSWTSSSIISHGHFAFMYGKIEARVRMCNWNGAFGAFWTLGDSFEFGYKENGHPDTLGEWWAYCGEFDIVEFYNHKLTCGTFFNEKEEAGRVWYDNYATGDWHVFAMEWKTDGSLIFTIDGNEISRTSATDNRAFHIPHFILINQAVGASGGTPDSGTTEITQYVDWIKYYPLSTENVVLNSSDFTITAMDFHDNNCMVRPTFNDNCINKSLTWSSSDTSKITVHAGLCVYKADGSATITATSKSGVSKSITLVASNGSLSVRS